MNTVFSKREKTLYIISAAILLVGLAGSGLIYLFSSGTEDGGYQILGGFVYPNATENSKRYIHDLQVYGGQSAVLADKFMRWFSSLWYGESLAYTVACISAFLSFCFFMAARIHRSSMEQHQHDNLR